MYIFLYLFMYIFNIYIYLSLSQLFHPPGLIFAMLLSSPPNWRRRKDTTDTTDTTDRYRPLADTEVSIIP